MAADSKSTGKGKVRPVRVPDDEWEDLIASTRRADTSAAAVIRQSIRAYIGRPGAEYPRLPPPPPPSE